MRSSASGRWRSIPRIRNPRVPSAIRWSNRFTSSAIRGAKVRNFERFVSLTFARVISDTDPSFTEYSRFSDDVVYLEGEAERQEYVMAEDGLIWRGSRNRLRPTVWKYAQFERDILDCTLHLMNEIGKVRVSGRNDPVIITRCLSAAVSHAREIGSRRFEERI